MNTFNRILFVANGAAAEPHALARAGALAEASGANLLTVMDIRGSAAPARPRPDGFGESSDLGYLIAQAPVLPSSDGSHVSLETESTIDDVIEAARTHDLVIMPARDKAIARRGRAIKEDRLIMRYCGCPVLVIKVQAQARPRRVLAVVNLDLTLEDSTRARATLDTAAALASVEHASLEVADSWQIQRELELRGRANVTRLMSEMEAAHRKQLVALVAERGLSGTAVHLAYGEPQHAIPPLVKRREIDLVVVGNKPPTALVRLLAGTSAEKLLQRLDCSLLAVSSETARVSARLRQKRRPSFGQGRRRMANSAHA